MTNQQEDIEYFMNKPLNEAIKNVQNIIVHKIPSLRDFITVKLLSRPPIHFIHAIIVHLCVEPCGKPKPNFAYGVFTSNELNRYSLLEKGRKADKIRFLVKILAYVSYVSGHLVDIYTAPAKILSGQEVRFTLWFLFILGSICNNFDDDEEHKQAADYVVKVGPTMLYQKSVKIRSTIVRVQARYRGIVARKQCIDRRVGINNVPYISLGQTVPEINIYDCEGTDSRETMNKSLDTGQIDRGESILMMNENKLFPKNSMSEILPQRSIVNKCFRGNDHIQLEFGPPYSAPAKRVTSHKKLSRSRSAKSLPPLRCNYFFKRQLDQNCSNDKVEFDKITDKDKLNHDIKRERSKLRMRTKKVNCIEKELQERENLIELKESKISKLAESLRRRQIKLTAAQKKESEEKSNATGLSGFEIVCAQEQKAAIISSSKARADAELRKRTKELEETFRRKEIELAEKERRISQLASNIQKQHERLVTKEKKVELLEASLSIQRATKLPVEIFIEDVDKDNNEKDRLVNNKSTVSSNKNSPVFKCNPEQKSTKVKRKRNKKKDRSSKSRLSSLTLQSNDDNSSHGAGFNEFNPHSTAYVHPKTTESTLTKKTNKGATHRNIDRQSLQCIIKTQRTAAGAQKPLKQNTPMNVTVIEECSKIKGVDTGSTSKRNFSEVKQFIDRSKSVGPRKEKHGHTNELTHVDNVHTNTLCESSRMKRRQSTKTVTASQAFSMYQSYRFSFDKSPETNDKLHSNIRKTVKPNIGDGDTLPIRPEPQEKSSIRWNASFNDKLEIALRFCPIKLDKGVIQY